MTALRGSSHDGSPCPRASSPSGPPPSPRPARSRFGPATAWSSRRTPSPRRSGWRCSSPGATPWTPRWRPPSPSPSCTPPRATWAGAASCSCGRRAGPSGAVYDFREQAPAAASPTMFLKDGRYSSDLHHGSPLAVGVPGTVAGLHMAWVDNGRMPWKGLLQPAIALARDGFMVSDGLARSLREVLPRMKPYPASVAQFSRQGVPYETGDLLQQPDLAKTLERIAEKGARGFYEGETAALIEKEMKARGGLVTREDLRGYTIYRRAPLRGNLPRRRGADRAAPERGGRHPPPVPQHPRGPRRARDGLRLLAPRPPRGRGAAAGLRRPVALPGRPRLREGHADRAPRLEGARRSPPQDDPRGPGLRLLADDVRVAGGERGDDPLLGGRRRSQRGGAHHHARGQLRLEDGGAGRGLPAQQRDGRLQRRAGPDRRQRPRRHRAEPGRAGQAHAVEHDPDDRDAGRPAPSRDGQPRRAHDPEHRPARPC